MPQTPTTPTTLPSSAEVLEARSLFAEMGDTYPGGKLRRPVSLFAVVQAGLILSRWSEFLEHKNDVPTNGDQFDGTNS